MPEAQQFPGPEPGDPEDVAWTLTTAGTMWSRGELAEAVRWLRRAAEAAGDNGNDLRAVTLAKAAADLTASLGDRAPASSPSADQTSRMAVPPVSRPDNPAPIPPVEDADAHYEADFTIPEGLHAVDRPPFVPPPLPTRPGASRPPPPSSRSAPEHAAPPAPSRPHSPPPSRPLPPSSAPRHPVPSKPPPSVRPSAVPSGVRPRQTLRVAVEPASDDPKLLHVRPLAEDEPVPPGAHEALLTALEPGAHLLAKKR